MLNGISLRELGPRCKLKIIEVRPYKENPMYWQYKGEPVLLLGGSTNDNLFQQAFSGLDEELYRLASYGGNYLRCTMSSGDEEYNYPFCF